MTWAVAFWVVWLLALVLTTWVNWPIGRGAGPWALVLALLFLLGWSTYGPPLH